MSLHLVGLASGFYTRNEAIMSQCLPKGFSMFFFRAICNMLTSTLFLSTLPACTFINKQSTTDKKTVNLAQSAVRYQSIGNCWAYAVIGWIESLNMRTNPGQTQLNLSESYLTYRMFEKQLLTDLELKSIDGAGSWEESVTLLLRYGVMLEGEFIPKEADINKSLQQEKALKTLNESLKSGPLSKDRSSAMVRIELDRAFEVKLDMVESRIIKAQDLVIGRSNTGRTIALSSQLERWQVLRWDSISGTPPESSNRPVKFTSTHTDMLARAKKAMGAGYPVVIAWFVDFNALGDDGVFSSETLKNRGPGKQGYHMVVAEDYVATGVNPETGIEFASGEGQTTDEMRTLAEKFGVIESFLVKNSWGGLGRDDRSSYLRDGAGGYHRLNGDYLFSWVNMTGASASEQGTLVTALYEMVLPPGF